MPSNNRSTTAKHSSRRGFTLIEVLVVVAIIALLIAILLPSLSRAREQAKIASCAANSKQVGTMMAMYQATYKGTVPVVFNYHANNPDPKVPARTAYLSVALRHFDRTTAPQKQWVLKGNIRTPDDRWTGFTEDGDSGELGEYEEKIADHWVCPFARGKPKARLETGSFSVTDDAGTNPYTHYKFEGRHESYHTWLWDNVFKNTLIDNYYPTNIPDRTPGPGRPKYSVLSWNQLAVRSPTDGENDWNGNDPDVFEPWIWRYRSWNDGDLRRGPQGGGSRAASLSDCTVIFCGMGSHISRDGFVNNMNSHRRGTGGGTNVTFADTHVEWVQWNQVGWP